MESLGRRGNLKRHSSNISRRNSVDYSKKTKHVKALFEKAKKHLTLDKGSQLWIQLYIERKLLIFTMIHLIITVAVWYHFSSIKWQENLISVQDDEDHYMWKRVGPTILFGSKHAILLQMLLIPLTMSKFSVAALSETIVNRFVPLNRALKMHIYLGYTMILLTFFATVGFFIYFGALCSFGDQDVCDKLTSEIMFTGYGIVVFLLLMLSTSYYRYKIPYEVFYVMHHLLFVVYFVTILHTVDHVQRSGARDRYQTFEWFSITIFFYIFDRCNMHMNHKYDVPMESVTKHLDRNGAKMIVLRLQRPSLFRFKPGQYATLRMQDIEVHWHPFSIASHPTSPIIEFYIEVFDENSWTGKLWNMLTDDHYDCGDDTIRFELMGPFGTSLAKTEEYSHALAIGAGTGIVPVLSLLRQHVNVMTRLSPGAYLSNVLEREKKILAVKNATQEQKGSIAQRVYRSCLRPTHVRSETSMRNVTEENSSRRRSVLRSTIRENLTRMHSRFESYKEKGGETGDNDEINFARHGRGRNLANSLTKSMNVNNLSKSMNVNNLSKSMNVNNLSKSMNVNNLSKSINISHIRKKFVKNDDDDDDDDDDLTRSSLTNYLSHKKDIIKASNEAMKIIYHKVYQCVLPPTGVALTCLLFTDLSDQAFVYVASFNLIYQLLYSFIALFVWKRFRLFAYFDLVVILATIQVDFAYMTKGRTSPTIMATAVLNLIISFRFWDVVVKPLDDSWANSIDDDGLNHIERLELIWVTRSVDFVTKILPDIEKEWDALVNAWTKDDAYEVCRISVYVTDKNKESQDFLNSELKKNNSFLKDQIIYGRPDFKEIIEDYNVELMSTMKFSYSLLAFCGSPTLAKFIGSGLTSNEVLKNITGYKEHHMEFISEAYGGVKSASKKKKKKSPKKEEEVNESCAAKTAVKVPTRDDGTPKNEEVV